MKKLIFLFLILFLLFPSLSYALTRTIDSDATNWSAATSWVEGAVPTTADAVVANAASASITIDTATCVASTMVLTGYTKTMTFTAGQKLTVTTTVTFVAGMTIAGTGTLQFGNTATITSAGKTFSGSLIFDAGTWTLADNWTVTGSISAEGIGDANILNGNTMNIGGGLNLTASTSNFSGTTTLNFNGTGTLQSAAIAIGNSVANNITINTAGIITIGTYFTYQTGTLTYTSGTVDATTNSSTLGITGACALNTNGINWYNITVQLASSATITLSSNLTCTATLTVTTSSDIVTTSGAFDISCANFYINAGSTWNMKSSETLTISNSMYLSGDGILTTTMKAVTALTAFNLDYNGTVANCGAYKITFTDVDASLSAQGIDNWYGGTLTNTTNITNRTSADIGGGTTTDIFGWIQ